MSMNKVLCRLVYDTRRYPLLSLQTRLSASLFSQSNEAPHQQLLQTSPFVIVRRTFANHQARLGNHLEKLDDLAHEKSRKEAQEKRKKKKEKKAARKGGTAGAVHEDEDEDHDQEDEEIMLPDPQETKTRMLKILNSFVESLKAIRGAEPTAELFDDILVDAYGASTPLKAVAQVVIVSPTRATASCFDPSLTKAVSTAIREQLSFNPSVDEDGTVVIPIPRVSLETRQQTAAALKKKAEDFRNRIRKVRRRELDIVKKGVAGKLEHISKDDAFRVQTEIEAVTEEVIQQLNQAADQKLESIMTV